MTKVAMDRDADAEVPSANLTELKFLKQNLLGIITDEDAILLKPEWTRSTNNSLRCSNNSS